MELRGGRIVLIGPLHPNDRDRFVEGIGRASPDSVYKRFMTPMPRLSDRQLSYLLGVDHRDHEALLAIDEEGGEAVGVGRFIRSEESPDTAEAAMLVIDDWHGLGLGKALCLLLAARARAVGIERFEATMLAENRAMMAVLRSLGEPRRVAGEGMTVTVEVALPEAALGERIRGTLRKLDDGGYELAAPGQETT